MVAAQTFSIEFDGCWRERSKGGVPAQSGVYCVYTCKYTADDTVSIKKLVYIGESHDVKLRISNHEKQKDWEPHLENGEELCYSFGPVTSAHRERCEAALIFKHKPPENTEYKHSFPFDQTTLNLSGKTILLDTKFKVDRT